MVSHVEGVVDGNNLDLAVVGVRKACLLLYHCSRD